jgi:hypothetical protein
VPCRSCAAAIAASIFCSAQPLISLNLSLELFPLRRVDKSSIKAKRRKRDGGRVTNKRGALADDYLCGAGDSSARRNRELITGRRFRRGLNLLISCSDFGISFAGRAMGSANVMSLSPLASLGQNGADPDAPAPVE